jgi:hypothetical protein
MFLNSAPKFALSIALFAIAGAVQASEVDNCIDEISRVCGSGSQFQSVLARKTSACKNLDSSSGATRTQIYQLTNGEVLSVRVKGQGSCRFQLAQIHEGDAVSGGDNIVETKVEGNKAFFRGSKGGGYLARMEGNGIQFYELLSGRGNPYRFRTGTGVKDIKGTGDAIEYILASSPTGNTAAVRKVKPQNVQQEIRDEKLRARDFPDVGISNLWTLLANLDAPLPPPGSVEDKSGDVTFEVAKNQDGNDVPPPPPYGYDYEIKNVYTPSSMWGFTSASLGDCQGTVTVERRASNQVKVSFSVGSCSRVEWERVDGQDLDVPTARLNTESRPYTGSFVVTGNAYRTSNNARFVLHSRSGETGVKVYVHF